MPSLVIVGAGPRGVGILERLLASATELAASGPLVIHLVDPYPPGAGRVWRHDQSPLMRLNSMARDVTVWTDDSVQMAGPPRPGPTLAEWMQLVAAEGVHGPDGTVDEALSAEARVSTGISFNSRQLQRAYLAWFFEEVRRRAPGHVEIVVHPTRVVAITDATPHPDAPQVVHLESGARIEADAVVLALGHLDRDPSGPEAELAGFAARHGAVYVPPSYTADEDLSVLRPGHDVIVRGFGLAFIDLMVLVTEERGGRYHEDGGGRLTYTPSGEEPRLWIGSRRGVPYRAKLTYDLLGGRPDLPRYFTAESVAALAAAHDRLEFGPHVWPLLAKELVWAYYRELALGHPGRVTLGFEEFDARFATVSWGSPEMAALVAEAVPAAADRVDLAHLDRPLAGLQFASAEDLEAHIHDHVVADLARRGDPRWSADLGLFMATLAVMGTLPRVLATGQLSTRSRVEDIDGWWWGFFSYYSSGPPPERLQQLLALHRAGVARFVGPDMWVESDEQVGRWRAGSPASPRTVEANALVDARLPKPSVSTSRDPLVRGLHARGEVGEEVLGGVDGFRWRSGYLTVERNTMQILDAAGRAHPRRFALGANTSTGRGGAFARPRTNALAFRQNDQVARLVLDLLAAVPQPAGLTD
jgi:uncharacterized NAD(P)/FAD-binding protein YdhS